MRHSFLIFPALVFFIFFLPLGSAVSWTSANNSYYYFTNLYDQSLNTTDNVSFNNLNLTGSFNGNVTFNNLSNFPSACPAGTAIQAINATSYTCINITGASVNSSNYWDSYDTPSDLNYLILVSWSNITDRYTHLSNFTNDLGYTHLSNFTDDLGNRGYTHLTNFTNDLGLGNWSADSSNYYNKTEVDANVSAANTSMKDYVDLLNASGLIRDWNASGLLINWSEEISVEETLWNANYTTFLTHISWADAVNGTIYLSSNPFGFYNETNPQSEADPLWTGNQSNYYNITDVDSNISTANSSMKDYVDLLNASGLIRDWNDTGLIIDWNGTGLIINWSEIISSDEPLWTDNFTKYNASWSSVVNESYYLATNPFRFYNSTTWDNPYDYYNETDFNVSDFGNISGGGDSTYIAYWDDTDTIVGESTFIWNHLLQQLHINDGGSNRVLLTYNFMEVTDGTETNTISAGLIDIEAPNDWVTIEPTLIEISDDGSNVSDISKNEILTTDGSEQATMTPTSITITDYSNITYIKKDNITTTGFIYSNGTEMVCTAENGLCNQTAGITWADAVNGTLYSSYNPFGFYNETDFNISDYYNKTEVDANISDANTSMKGYVDAQDTSFNNSMKDYVDLLNATGLIINWSEIGGGGYNDSWINDTFLKLQPTTDTIINDAGNNQQFIIEGDTTPHLFWITESLFTGGDHVILSKSASGSTTYPLRLLNENGAVTNTGVGIKFSPYYSGGVPYDMGIIYSYRRGSGDYPMVLKSWAGGSVEFLRSTYDYAGIQTGEVLPRYSNSYDIGTASLVWRNIYAITYNDLTPAWNESKEGSALDAVLKISEDANGEINHTSYPITARGKYYLIPKEYVFEEYDEKTNTTKNTTGVEIKAYKADESKSIEQQEIEIKIIAGVSNLKDAKIVYTRDIGATITMLLKSEQEIMDRVSSLENENKEIKASLCKLGEKQWC